MEKKGVIVIAVVAVVAIAVVGLIVAGAINQNEHNQKAETYYYIDGNTGETSDGKKVIEWTSQNLPGKDLFIKEKYHYILFNTKADGTGNAYWTYQACSEPKGTTLYASWDPNYVCVKGELTDNEYDYGGRSSEMLFKCGTETKTTPSTGNYSVSFDGTSVEPKNPGVFGDYVEIIIPSSSTATVNVEPNKITIINGNATYEFTLKDGATMTKIDETGQNEGVKLSGYSVLEDLCHFVKVDIKVTAVPPI